MPFSGRRRKGATLEMLKTFLEQAIRLAVHFMARPGHRTHHVAGALHWMMNHRATERGGGHMGNVH